MTALDKQKQRVASIGDDGAELLRILLIAAELAIAGVAVLVC